jgi:hypothetical protein
MRARSRSTQPFEFSGVVEAPGQQIYTTFHVAEAGAWVLEGLGSFTNSQWQLTGPLGTVVSTRSISGSDGAERARRST